MDDVLLELLQRTQQRRSPVKRIMGGIGKGLYVYGGGNPRDLHTERDNTSRMLQSEILKRMMPLSEEDQANIDYKKAMTELARRKGTGGIDPMAFEEEQQANRLERDNLQSELRRQEINMRNAQTLEEKAMAQAKINLLNKQSESLDFKMKNINAPVKSVAQQRFDLEQSNSKQRQDMAVEKARAKAQETLDTIGDLEKDIDFFGFKSYIPTIAGTKQAVFRTNLNNLISNKILDTINSMKAVSKTGATGFGALNEKELAVLSNAATKLKENLPAEEARNILEGMKPALNKLLTPMNDVDQELSDNKTGGQLMIDAQGNKAMVYPDGTFEEVQ